MGTHCVRQVQEDRRFPLSRPTKQSRMPMVVQVVRQYAPSRGGLEDVVANLAKSLPSHGYNTRVVTCDTLFSEPGRTLPARETIDGVEVVRIPWHGSPRYPLAPTIFRELSGADLIHVHAVDFFFDALAWGWPLHLRPMVATTHGGFFHTSNYRAIKRFWFQSMTRASSVAYRSIICCSQSDLELFSRIAARKTVLVENGVDSLKFASDRKGRPAKRLTTIGRFSRNKRLDRMLQTMKVLTTLDDEWTLDIIGSPSDLSVENLRGSIEALDLQRSVTVHVSPENNRIRDLLADSSLFVSASEYEGFGLVAVEAMGAGLVPVLHPNDAYRALSRKHGDIVLADFSSPEAAASTIRTAFETFASSTDEARLRLRGAANTYSWDGVAARYADVYASALETR